MPTNPILSTTIDALPIRVFKTNAEVGRAAAADAAAFLQQTIQERGQANAILATGNSQLTFLEALRGFPGVDWSKVNIFHMDEYIDLEPVHPASLFDQDLEATLLHHSQKAGEQSNELLELTRGVELGEQRSHAGMQHGAA